MIVPLVVYQKEDGREKFTVPIQQLNRIYNDTDSDLSSDDKEMVKSLLGDGVNYYIPKISDIPKEYLDMEYYKENRNEVIKSYITIVSKNPRIASEAFLENTVGFWYPYASLVLYPDGEGAYWPVEAWEFWNFEPKIPGILNFFKIFENSDFIMNNSIAKLLFYPGSLFFLFIIMFGYSLYKKKTSFNVVFLYILMLYGTYFLGPVALVRYSIYLYAIVPLYFAFLKNKIQ